MDVCDGAVFPGEGKNGVGEIEGTEIGVLEANGKLHANMDSDNTRLE